MSELNEPLRVPPQETVAPVTNLPQPVYPPAPEMPIAVQPITHTHKKLLVIIVIVVGVIIGGFAVYARLNSTITKEAQNTPAQYSTVSDVDLSSLGSAYDNYRSAGVADFSVDKKTATLQAFTSLSHGFSLSPKFFEDSSAVLIGLGIAHGSLDHTSQSEGYRNGLYLLSTNYLSSVPDGIVDEYFVSPATNESTTPAVLAQYTDQAVSAQLNAVLQSNDLNSEIIKNLRLPSNARLAAFTPLVMNFETNSAEQDAFGDKHYMFGAHPKMWVESVGDTVYLIMTKNYAEDFIANPSGDGRHTVLHEIIHTQHVFVRGDLGRSIEERRAELFSGDLSAYYDAKQLFIYTDVFSGFSPLQDLQTHAIDSDSFYTQLYSKLGVEGANAFVTSNPSAFLSEPSTAVKKVQEAFGGMDAAIKIAIQKGSPDSAAMNDRIRARSDKLLSILKSKQAVIDDLTNNLADVYGMPSAADVMKQYIQTR